MKSTDRLMKYLKMLKEKTTVGHTGSNACGDDKITEPFYGSVVVKEAGKRITTLSSVS
jgi:hypothetical protein